MKKKILGIFVCTLLIAATGITVAGTLTYARDTTAESSDEGVAATSREPWYNLAGSWMRSDKKYICTHSLISMAGGGRYAMTGQYLADDPSLWWLGIDAVTLSTIHGEAVRTGHNTYDVTMLAYAVNETYNFAYFSVYSGTAEMTSHNTFNTNFTAAYYSPDQDPFGDEEPEYLCYGPYEYSYERIPIV